MDISARSEDEAYWTAYSDAGTAANSDAGTAANSDAGTAANSDADDTAHELAHELARTALTRSVALPAARYFERTVQPSDEGWASRRHHHHPRHGRLLRGAHRHAGESDWSDGNESSCSEQGFVPDASSSDDDEGHAIRRAVRMPRRRAAAQPLSAVPESEGAHGASSPEVGAHEEDAAAARVQALHRGRQHRRQLAEEAAAAAKVQALHRGRRQRQRMTFEEATAPRPYLVVACSYTGAPFELRSVVSEAAQVEASAQLVTRLDNCSVQTLRAHLQGCRGLHLLCHGDAPLQGECVPLLGSGQAPEAISIESFIGLIRPHASAGSGSLQHVYLGGCRTFALGAALHERAAVPSVVCYKGRVDDRAAALFGTELVSAMARGDDAGVAFSAARARVLAETETGFLDNGMRGAVQRFAFHDPDSADVHHCSMHSQQCAVTGQLRSQCPWRGRLKPPPDTRISPRWRGRVATGEPWMLTSNGTATERRAAQQECTELS
eukprot:555517-Prymnesium_polylepis.1